MSGRDHYWDTLKFVLIFLVVYGHIETLRIGGGRINLAIYNFIFSFHMPLFVFISGRFSHIRNKEKYFKGILKILETYCVFQFLRTCVSLISGKELSWDCLFIPNWILWYIVVLIYWRLLVYYLSKTLNVYKYLFICLSIVIGIFSGFIQLGDYFAIHRALTFLPFFVIGYYSINYDIQNILERIPMAIPIGYILLYFLLLFYYGDEDLINRGFSPFYGDICQSLLSRCIFFILAFVLSIMVMRLVTPQKGLAILGQYTLFVYIYHSFAINILNYVIERKNLSTSVFCLFIYACFVFFVLMLLSRSKFLRFLLNPFSNLLQGNILNLHK